MLFVKCQFYHKKSRRWIPPHFYFFCVTPPYSTLSWYQGESSGGPWAGCSLGDASIQAYTLLFEETGNSGFSWRHTYSPPLCDPGSWFMVASTRSRNTALTSMLFQHLISLLLTSDIAVLYLYQHRYHSLRIRGTVISQTLLPVQPVHQASGKCVWSCHSLFWSGHYPAYKCGKSHYRILVRFGDGCKHRQIAKAAHVVAVVAPTTLIADIVMCA